KVQSPKTKNQKPKTKDQSQVWVCRLWTLDIGPWTFSKPKWQPGALGCHLVAAISGGVEIRQPLRGKASSYQSRSQCMNAFSPPPRERRRLSDSQQRNFHWRLPVRLHLLKPLRSSARARLSPPTTRILLEVPFSFALE